MACGREQGGVGRSLTKVWAGAQGGKQGGRRRRARRGKGRAERADDGGRGHEERAVTGDSDER